MSALIKGNIEHIKFEKEDTGFYIFVTETEGRGKVDVKGSSARTLRKGDTVEISGNWYKDPAYGLQIRATSIKVVTPETPEGIIAFLSSGLIKGIGEQVATRIVEKFGADTLAILKTEPDKLLSVNGIGKKNLEKIKAAYADVVETEELMIFLTSNGVSTNFAVKIQKEYGHNAMHVMTTNPYRICNDIRGIGFPTADKIAMQLGIPKNSMKRMKAGVMHVIDEAAKDGHCFQFGDKLIESTEEMLEAENDLVQSALVENIDNKSLIFEDVGKHGAIFIPKLYEYEKNIARDIHRIKDRKNYFNLVNACDNLERVEREEGITLSISQKKAAITSIENKFTVITGGAGVGKTTVVNSILKALSGTSADIILCAPTGKAAKRLEQSTKREAKTIHRTLEFTGGMEEGELPYFARNSQNPLEADLVVVDEASMIDVSLMNSFIDAVGDNTSVILVGDVNQLPSIGAGFVLNDIISSGCIPVSELTEIQRQAEGSDIIKNSHTINNGGRLYPTPKGINTDFHYIEVGSDEEAGDMAVSIATKHAYEVFGFDPMTDIQVLCPMKKTSSGTTILNERIKRRLISEDAATIKVGDREFSVGDKVIQTKNNYEKEIFNGDVGFIREIHQSKKELVIDFENSAVRYTASELIQISLAYAITIHKSQGSEYPCVIIPMTNSHYVMLERSLLYTAVTRGKQKVILIGQRQAVDMAINNKKSERRLTMLENRLNHFNR
ncbi:hypothetical protein AB832_05670 [Flavobacteriaceae bacterium (ex Bugula neritina AB1)]|nr:hypothetical protein AB832_05670 [Flavobacteriaceae bacterium (ex Bugula neritina AB1)]